MQRALGAESGYTMPEVGAATGASRICNDRGFNELEKKVRSLVVHPAMTWIRMDSSERYDNIRWCCGGAPL